MRTGIPPNFPAREPRRHAQLPVDSVMRALPHSGRAVAPEIVWFISPAMKLGTEYFSLQKFLSISERRSYEEVPG